MGPRSRNPGIEAGEARACVKTSRFELECKATGARLCRLCRKYRHWSESMQLGKRARNGQRRWFCARCFEDRKPEIIDIVGRSYVEAFINSQGSVE